MIVPQVVLVVDPMRIICVPINLLISISALLPLEILPIFVLLVVNPLQYLQYYDSRRPITSGT